MEEIAKYLRGLLLLQIQQMSGGEAFQKPEILLSRSGFTNKEIADILQKSPDAVKKVLQRARKKLSEEEN
jgi:DNA-directed RNA polymerase specialized sigma24 family protein